MEEWIKITDMAGSLATVGLFVVGAVTLYYAIRRREADEDDPDEPTEEPPNSKPD